MMKISLLILPQSNINSQLMKMKQTVMLHQNEQKIKGFVYGVYVTCAA